MNHRHERLLDRMSRLSAYVKAESSSDRQFIVSEVYIGDSKDAN